MARLRNAFRAVQPLQASGVNRALYGFQEGVQGLDGACGKCGKCDRIACNGILFGPDACPNFSGPFRASTASLLKCASGTEVLSFTRVAADRSGHWAYGRIIPL